MNDLRKLIVPAEERLIGEVREVREALCLILEELRAQREPTVELVETAVDVERTLAVALDRQFGGVHRPTLVARAPDRVFSVAEAGNGDWSGYSVTMTWNFDEADDAHDFHRTELDAANAATGEIVPIPKEARP